MVVNQGARGTVQLGESVHLDCEIILREKKGTNQLGIKNKNARNIRLRPSSCGFITCKKASRHGDA